MARRVVLSVGTKRGLFLVESGIGRRRWSVRGPYLKGWSVPYAFVDTRGRRARIHASASHFTYGSTTLAGPLSGRRFTPAAEPIEFPELNPKARRFVEQYGIDRSKKVWIIAPGPEDQKRVLYAGTAPAGLFRSENGGRTWAPVEGLNRHPSRKDWFPGAGGQALHSFQIDPREPRRMWAAISAAGAFRSEDGGQRWEPINRAVAEYVGAPKESLVGT